MEIEDRNYEVEKEEEFILHKNIKQI